MDTDVARGATVPSDRRSRVVSIGTQELARRTRTGALLRSACIVPSGLANTVLNSPRCSTTSTGSPEATAAASADSSPVTAAAGVVTAAAGWRRRPPSTASTAANRPGTQRPPRRCRDVDEQTCASMTSSTKLQQGSPTPRPGNPHDGTSRCGRPRTPRGANGTSPTGPRQTPPIDDRRRHQRQTTARKHSRVRAIGPDTELSTAESALHPEEPTGSPAARSHAGSTDRTGRPRATTATTPVKPDRRVAHIVQPPALVPDAPVRAGPNPLGSADHRSSLDITGHWTYDTNSESLCTRGQPVAAQPFSGRKRPTESNPRHTDIPPRRATSHQHHDGQPVNNPLSSTITPARCVTSHTPRHPQTTGHTKGTTKQIAAIKQ